MNVTKLTDKINLKEAADLLSLQNSHIRKSWKKIMEYFASIETGDVVIVKMGTRVEDDGMILFLRLGDPDLIEGYGDDIYREIDNDLNNTWDLLPVYQLRSFIKNLPVTIDQIKTIMTNKQQINDSLNDIISKFDKLEC